LSVRGLRSTPKDRLGASKSAAALACLLLASACAAPFPEPAPPIAAAASEAMLEAWEASRRPGFAGDDALQEAALDAAARASAMAPGWVPPERFIDDWGHRPWLTLPERYGRHLEGARAGRAGSAYLAGRLGGAAADVRLRAARDLDPSLPWPHHGLAWRRHLAGATGSSIRAGQAAYTLSVDPGERAHFAVALARYLDATDDRALAENLLRMALADDGALAPRPPERLALEAALAPLELESIDPSDVRRGVARAVRLLGERDLDAVDRLALVARLRAVPGDLVTREEVVLALLDARAEARTALEEASIDAVLRVARGLDGEGRLARTEREALVDAILAGEVAAGVLAWLEALPRAVLDERGRPLRAELAAVVEAALWLRPVAEADGEPTAPGVLADALLGAGWFDEAEALATAYAETAWAEEAREIERRAAEGRAALAAVNALARRVDAQRAFANSGADGTAGDGAREGGRVDSLRELEGEVARLLGRVGGEIERSPAIEYGPIGEVLHPGPRFSAEDERLGRGAEGEPVPGIAALFDRLGRFALLGRAIGQGGPDVTVLRVLHVEERAGEHLGRPFRGTVFWCQGADVPGRFGRRGASISGAALHEGYYVDLEVLESEHARWRFLEDRFGPRPERLRAALEAPGALVPALLRAEASPALGAGDRVRLAVMAEAGDGALTVPPIDAFAEVVALHEEGHLCDRAQWYPITFARALRLAGYALSHGFDGGAISRDLEARAQLVALCVAPDPRLPLIDLLDAAEADGGPQLTPHAAAYRELLAALLTRLDGTYERGELDGLGRGAPGLDPGRRWIDQLHRLSPATIRALARDEARARGLVAPGT